MKLYRYRTVQYRNQHVTDDKIGEVIVPSQRWTALPPGSISDCISSTRIHHNIYVAEQQ